MPKTISGKKAITLLVKHYNFQVVNQKGSHVKLQKRSSKRVCTTIVPVHRELAFGTLRGIFKQAEVDYKEFQKLM